MALRDSPLEEVRKFGTRLTIHFQDINERKYEAEFVMSGDETGKPMYYPGSGEDINT